MQWTFHGRASYQKGGGSKLFIISFVWFLMIMDNVLNVIDLFVNTRVGQKVLTPPL